jgi:hypothetical protein
MPDFLERKLRREYGNNPRAIYGTMNNMGAMRGNKETAKGKAMQRKHDKKKRLHRGVTDLL